MLWNVIFISDDGLMTDTSGVQMCDCLVIALYPYSLESLPSRSLAYESLLNLALVGGTPHYFLCDLILFICFVFLVFFRSSVYHSSLEEHSLTLCLTCAIPLVLYFLTHWGQCAILAWGWGRNFCLSF
jgi:hypothetical protein